MLFLMRHGQASWASDTDMGRALTDRGRQEIEGLTTEHLAGLKRIDKIICSPYLRTRQTAEIVARPLAIDVIIEPNITPSNTVQEAVFAIEKHWSDNLLVVMHQPLIGTLISYLEHGEKSTNHFPEFVEPGSMYGFSLPWPGPGCAIRQSLFSV